jgi:hypothetical protein
MQKCNGIMSRFKDSRPPDNMKVMHHAKCPVLMSPAQALLSILSGVGVDDLVSMGRSSLNTS